MITTAFSDNANTIDNWIKGKARRPQSAAANSAQAVEFYSSGQQAFDDIINRIQSNVKDAPDGKVYHQDVKLDIRGYFEVFYIYIRLYHNYICRRAPSIYAAMKRSDKQCGINYLQTCVY